MLQSALQATMTESLIGDDIATTCHQARWCKPTPGRAEYGAPGSGVCAVIEKDTPDAKEFGWMYSVFCSVAKRRARGRRHIEEACLDDATGWLGVVNCPGQVR